MISRKSSAATPRSSWVWPAKQIGSPVFSVAEYSPPRTHCDYAATKVRTDVSPRRTQRGAAATESRSISRKDAKAAKVTGGGPSSRADARDLRKISPFDRNDNDSFLATLRLGGRNIRLRVLSASRLFAHAAQILNYSSTKSTKFKSINIRTLRVLRALRGARK
jgi:hypothetical protein